MSPALAAAPGSGSADRMRRLGNRGAWTADARDYDRTMGGVIHAIAFVLIVVIAVGVKIAIVKVMRDFMREKR